MTEVANPVEPPPPAAPAPVAKECGEDKEQVSGTKTSDKVIRVRKLGGILSIFTIILSLPIMASVVWLLYMKDYDCEYLLKLPGFQIGIGVGLIFVFLISNVVVFLRSKFPVPSFFVVMLPLIVMLIMGLALMGAYKLESRKLLATPMWFREKVRDNNNWDNIRSCIVSKGACDDLRSRLLAIQSYDFSMKHLSPVESGCCKPPKICGLKYVNATYWKRDEKLDRKSHPDCEKWENDANLLCYDCESCKLGFAETMESKWCKLGLFLIFMSLFLLVSHLLLFVSAMWEKYNG